MLASAMKAEEVKTHTHKCTHTHMWYVFGSRNQDHYLVTLQSPLQYLLHNFYHVHWFVCRMAPGPVHHLWSLHCFHLLCSLLTMTSSPSPVWRHSDQKPQQARGCASQRPKINHRNLERSLKVRGNDNDNDAPLNPFNTDSNSTFLPATPTSLLLVFNAQVE